MIFIESSLSHLFQSAVDAFPHTTKRQHATDPIEISSIRWTPFLGMRTLMTKALAKNENREYSCFIVFKNVNYHTGHNQGLITLQTENHSYFLEKLSLINTHVLVRCSCPDFKWRFKYYDHLDRSLYGHKGKPYQSNGGLPANPMEMEGMCKHLMKLSETLRNKGLFNEAN